MSVPEHPQGCLCNKCVFLVYGLPTSPVSGFQETKDDTRDISCIDLPESQSQVLGTQVPEKAVPAPVYPCHTCGHPKCPYGGKRTKLDPHVFTGSFFDPNGINYIPNEDLKLWRACGVFGNPMMK